MKYKSVWFIKSVLESDGYLKDLFINIINKVEFNDSVNICYFSNTPDTFFVWFSTSNTENYWK